MAEQLPPEEILKIVVNNINAEKEKIGETVKLVNEEMQRVSNTPEDSNRVLGGNIGSIKSKWEEFTTEYNIFDSNMDKLTNKLVGGTNSVAAYSANYQAEMQMGSDTNV